MPDPVPREIDLVLDFLNSMDVEAGTDELRDRAAYDGWLRAHALPDRSSPADLDAARRLRAALRAAVGDSGDPAADHGELAVSVGVGLEDGRRPVLLAADPLGIIAANAALLSADGRWERLKICPADDCRWAFYDRSKNRSRHWCSMEDCGAKAKSRAFRERQRGRPPGRR